MPSSASSRIALRLNRPLVLVGLMGAGKTSVGRRLAEFLDVDFRDSDTEIEAAADMEIGEIFSRFGETYFREGEQRVIARLLDGAPVVLATGGGAFVRPENREVIAASALSIWLDAELETLWSRVKDRDTRPLLKAPNPRGILAELYEARRPEYAKADIRVQSDPGLTHEMMVRRILEAIRAYDLVRTDQKPTLERAVLHD